MCSYYEFRNWGLRCELTTCHIYYAEKKGLYEHTQELADYIDTVVSGGKKWEEWYIKL
jgi:hypothetical protein